MAGGEGRIQGPPSKSCRVSHGRRSDAVISESRKHFELPCVSILLIHSFVLPSHHRCVRTPE